MQFKKQMQILLIYVWPVNICEAICVFIWFICKCCCLGCMLTHEGTTWLLKQTIKIIQIYTC